MGMGGAKEIGGKPVDEELAKAALSLGSVVGTECFRDGMNFGKEKIPRDVAGFLVAAFVYSMVKAMKDRGPHFGSGEEPPLSSDMLW